MHRYDRTARLVVLVLVLVWGRAALTTNDGGWAVAAGLALRGKE